MKGKADTVYQPKGSYAASSHTHDSVIDSGNNTTKITFAYSKDAMTIGNATWIAAWNGYELRAMNKNVFAMASHTHNIESMNNFSTRVYDATVSRSANTVLAAPNGSNGAASFRKLVENDIPIHNNSYYKIFAAGSGQAGFIKVMTIKVTGSYQNQPIVFFFGQRGIAGMCRLTVLLSSADDAASTKLSGFYMAGNSMGIYAVNSSSGVFDIYIKKTENYDSIVLYNYYKGNYMSTTSITFSDTLVTSLPTGYVTATWGEKVTAAVSANHTDNSMTIQLNGGGTEGTNKFTFNGAAAKAINITPASIGAATSGHDHSFMSNAEIDALF